MKKELVDLQPKLEQAKIDNTKMMKVLEVESVQVEAKSKVVRVDEEAATLKANEAQALKNECESDLAEAIPALEMALSALDTLKVGKGKGDTLSVAQLIAFNRNVSAAFNPTL